MWFIEANNYPLWPKGTPYINELMNTLGVIEEMSIDVHVMELGCIPLNSRHTMLKILVGSALRGVS